MLNFRGLQKEYLSLYHAFIESIDEDTGEVDIDIATQLATAQASFEEKAINVAYVYEMLVADEDRLNKEIERLQSLSKRLKSRKDNLKAYLSNTILEAGYDKIKGDYKSISFRTSEQTVIDDESLLSEDMFTVKVEKKPSLTAIKQAIKDAESKGEIFVGAHIEKKKNIQIK